MQESELRLDGNAAAGVLSEVFVAEATSATVVCAGCGAPCAVGAVHVYANAPGLVLRCPGCSAVLMRFARVRGRLVVDMHGCARLAFDVHAR